MEVDPNPNPPPEADELELKWINYAQWVAWKPAPGAVENLQKLPQGLDGVNGVTLVMGGAGKNSSATFGAVRPRELKTYLRAGGTNLGVIDLRTRDAGNANPDYVIAGATCQYPVVDTPVTIDAAKKVFQDFDFNNPDTQHPLYILKDKKYLVFHCNLSSNRTPAIIRGYYANASRIQSAEMSKQIVLILQGGFKAYTTISDQEDGGLADPAIFKYIPSA